MDNLIINVRRCSNCTILEDRSAGIVIGNDGVCSLCKKDESAYKQKTWEEKKKIFEDLINKKRNKHSYDGLIMMSGGKDSTYLAYKLKREYGLNVIGMSIDNGFEYSESFDNAKKICDKLEIPYFILQPNLKELREFYQYITIDEKLRRDDYGQICFYCGLYLKREVDRFAQKLDVPLIFSGYNPDQVFDMGDSEIVEADPARIQYQQMIKKATEQKLKDAYDYTMEKKGAEMAKYFELPETDILYYYQHFQYDPLGMMDVIKKELNWEPIKRFKEHYIASGCKLISVLLHVCQKKNKTDYIQKEFASQIRRGSLDKCHVNNLLQTMKFDEDEMNEVLASINLTSEQMLSL